ncbi:MAG: Uma2 family endonuclease [Myxococcota bacterium]
MTLQPTTTGHLPRKRPLSVDEYHRMVEAGVLSPDERVELIEGELFEMSPHGPPHASILALLNQSLVRQTPEGWTVRPQLPLTVDDHSEPEPDLAVVADDAADWREVHPATAALVVEVADSSLALDRDKARLYARAGVGEYWLVDVAGRAVEVYRDPDPKAERYRTMETLSPGDTLQPRGLPRVSIAVTDMFA